MRGVILGAASAAPVLDLSHEVPPQDVRVGALFLRQSVSYFPPGCIFVCVVDPGVGSSRRILFARTKSHQFLAPDNGLLSWLPEPVVEWRVVENDKLFLKPVSETFHGRDIFAPVAARLSAGAKPAALGRPISDPTLIDWPKDGVILAFDRFGNAVTSIEGEVKSIRYKGKEIRIGKTYTDAQEGTAVALKGSSGLWEICVRDGSFAERSSAKQGDPFEFSR
jgi:S-adenosyl-L-methionine hydrolase (adenosine-forming)